MTLPNFLIIGAQKSGTTSLYHYLDEHPEVFMSRKKEPHFFSFEGREPKFKERSDKKKNIINTIEAYEQLFDGVTNEKAIGEASPSYLYEEQAAERIHTRIPDAKLIAILRDPVDRAYSHFLHAVRSGREPMDGFVQALDDEEKRRAEGWGNPYDYQRKGFYGAQLTRFLEYFPREQLLVFLFEDLSDDPRKLVRQMYDFIGVDADFTPDLSAKYNVTEAPEGSKSERQRGIFAKLFGGKKARKIEKTSAATVVEKPPFPLEIRERLYNVYREDMLVLQGLIDRDLSAWLKPPSKNVI